jgi:hypothetical protein
MSIVNLEIDYSKQKVVSKVNGKIPDVNGDVAIDTGASIQKEDSTISLQDSTALNTALAALPDVLNARAEFMLMGNFMIFGDNLEITVPKISGSGYIVIDGRAVVIGKPIKIMFPKGNSVRIVFLNISCPAFFTDTPDDTSAMEKQEILFDNIAFSFSTTTETTRPYFTLEGVNAIVQASNLGNTSSEAAGDNYAYVSLKKNSSIEFHIIAQNMFTIGATGKYVATDGTSNSFISQDTFEGFDAGAVSHMTVSGSDYVQVQGLMVYPLAKQAG